MTLEKRHLIYLLFLVIGSLLLVNPTNLNAEETEQVSEEVAEDTENEDAKMKKCMKEAKTNKDKKNCAKQNQQTVEEFIEDEGLRLIEGFLKIYTDEDEENYLIARDHMGILPLYMEFEKINEHYQSSLFFLNKRSQFLIEGKKEDVIIRGVNQHGLIELEKLNGEVGYYCFNEARQIL